MTARTGEFAVHPTLAASTQDVVTLANPSGSSEVTVLNRSNSAEITFSVGNPSEEPVTITGADQVDCFVLPAAIGALTVPCSSGEVVVNVYSAGAQPYSVIVG